MAIVSVAIVLSFHLKSEPSDFELRMAKPLGIVFWILAVSCLFLGVGNYISEFLWFLEGVLLTGLPETVEKYSRKAAIVQTGWKTQMVRGPSSGSRSALLTLSRCSVSSRYAS